MEPLLVTAELANGYSVSDPWSPALDGILAYWALREQLGEEAFALGMAGHGEMVEPELPLAREVHGDDWWWMCSSPLTEGEAGRSERWFHRRFDLGPATAHLPETTKSILTAGGPYKIYRNRRSLIHARALVWHCLGDADEIQRLLRRCSNVGFGHSKGYGAVRSWMVEPGGDGRLARFHRPLPEGFAREHGVAGVRLEWGIRPPGRLPQHRRVCVMPRA